MEGARSVAADAALAAERQFILTLGGFALEIPGATLVTHERLPVPRFNFAEVRGVGPERQSAFFERALDHYFQRALRPTFRVPLPVAPHLDTGLRRFGFRPRAAPLVLLLDSAARTRRAGTPPHVRPATRAELDLVASFWTAERERAEFRAALDVAWTHPNPDERLVPILAFRAGGAVAVALVYRHGTAGAIHAVATRPAARGEGAATDLVRYALGAEPAGRRVRYSMFADSPRLERRLTEFGFAPTRSFRLYELPPDAELALAAPGPAGPPRWRPPRIPGER